MKRPAKNEAFRQTRIILGLIIMLMVTGVAGFRIIEGWSILESLYMTVITISSVGFKEIKPLSSEGQVFCILLIIWGVGTWAYALASFTRLILEGELVSFYSRRREKKMIDTLKNHYIVCGFGRIGELVCRQLAEESLPFVVVEKRAVRCDELDKLDYLHIDGDATQEESLLAAHILEARCLILALGTDPANVYAVLIARHLNPALYIVCRCEDEDAEDKIVKAGANKVISPYTIGGRSMANAGIRPSVLEFMDLVTTKKELALDIEEVPVPKGSSLDGRSLMDSKIRERYGIIVVACETQDKVTVFNPPADYILRGGDVLIALGKRDLFQKLHKKLG